MMIEKYRENVYKKQERKRSKLVKESIDVG